MKILLERKLLLVGFVGEAVEDRCPLGEQRLGLSYMHQQYKEETDVEWSPAFSGVRMSLCPPAAAPWDSVLSITVLYKSLLMFLLIPQVFPAILQRCWY
ncbi:hypothetical protein AVEN_46431-1 [Araneus ventricosus]|uniref:Uncharacterized protein n=1 Tax=Araneus ventricosus TaxID=182803 RepID=A0A4Y2QJG7_ARAVE|nr:hypothetical protein AVEN_46431-1 [Araneus ventricosus]